MVHDKVVFCTAKKNVQKKVGGGGGDSEDGDYQDVSLGDETENNNNNNNLKEPVADSVLLSILSSMKKVKYTFHSIISSYTQK